MIFNGILQIFTYFYDFLMRLIEVNTTHYEHFKILYCQCKAISDDRKEVPLFILRHKL